MKTDNDKYSCWFIVNQHKLEQSFEYIQNEASSLFLEFLENKDYGTSIQLYRFNIFIEPIVNYGRHADHVFSNTVHVELSAHIDFNKFNQANKESKVKYLLNTALVLLTYMAERLVIPRDFDAKHVVQQFQSFLVDKGMLLEKDELENTVIKYFDTTRFRFHVTTTIEIFGTKIHYDLVDLEYYINNCLAGKTFGDSVRHFDFGYEIFDFKGKFASFRKNTEGLKRYGKKDKNLLVVKQFDFRKVKKLSPEQQFDYLTKNILQAINDVDDIARGPKDFDKQRFYNLIEEALSNYKSEKIITLAPTTE